VFNSYNHWRNTARPVRFFNVDYRAGIFLFIFMMHVRLWTFCILLLVLFVLFLLERRGLSFTLALRRLRLWFIGAHRPALAKLHERKFTDNGGL
jgi:intracellular multiplication protein IcmT